MKNPFRPFTGDSLLVALGMTLVSYLVFPMIKEFMNPSKEKGKEKFYLDNKDHLFRANKESI